MEEISDALKALADDTRLRIIKILSKGELCVCELVDILKIPQYRVSRHLGILKKAGWVKDRRDGAWIYYSLATQKKIFQEELLRIINECLDEEVLRQDSIRQELRLSLRVGGRCVVGFSGREKPFAVA